MSTPDVLAPRSRHNRHVTTPADLAPVGDWSREQLYAAVEVADDHDAVVVIDYGRSSLCLVEPVGLSYRPPRALGFASPPVLLVADPLAFDPNEGTVTALTSDDVADPLPDLNDLPDAPAGSGQTGVGGSEESTADEHASDGATADEHASDGATADGGLLPPEADEDRFWVAVTPQFDILVPAFDWEEEPDDEPLPPVERRETPSSTGTPT